MNLGKSLFEARKKSGLSQEVVAEKLSISRQTISRWETNESLPDINQAKKLAKLYNLSLDKLFNFDIKLAEIERGIENSNPKDYAKIDWTKAWGKKYPVLVTYQNKVDVAKYAKEIKILLSKLEKEYNYNKLDAMLVLKDILGHVYFDNKK